MLSKGAPPAARMGLCGTAAAAAKPLPQFLYKRETDTEPRCNGRLRGVPGFQGLYNALTEVLRVRSHTSDYALDGPDMQLQTALAFTPATGPCVAHVVIQQGSAVNS